MIFPNMATTLGFVFTDASSSQILKQVLTKILRQHLMLYLVMGIQVQMIWFLFFRLIKLKIHLLKVN